MIDKRFDQLIANELFAAGVNYIKIMEITPPKLRPGLEKIFYEHNDYDCDAGTLYRESERQWKSATTTSKSPRRAGS